MGWIKAVFFVVPLGFIAAGLWLLISGGQAVSAAEGWERTEGVVLSARRIDPSSRGMQRSGNTYHVAITYRYEVGGRPYVGDRVWLTQNTGWGTAEAADEFLADFPVGGDVTVMYDPQDPEQAALSLARGWYLPLVLLGFGLVALYTVFKAMRPRSKAAAGKRRPAGG